MRGRALSAGSPGGATPINHSLPSIDARHCVTRRCRAILEKPRPTLGNCMTQMRGTPPLSTRLASFADPVPEGAAWPPVRTGRTISPNGAKASEVNSLSGSQCCEAFVAASMPTRSFNFANQTKKLYGYQVVRNTKGRNGAVLGGFGFAWLVSGSDRKCCNAR